MTDIGIMGAITIAMSGVIRANLAGRGVAALRVDEPEQLLRFCGTQRVH